MRSPPISELKTIKLQNGKVTLWGTAFMLPAISISAFVFKTSTVLLVNTELSFATMKTGSEISFIHFNFTLP